MCPMVGTAWYREESNARKKSNQIKTIASEFKSAERQQKVNKKC